MYERWNVRDLEGVLATLHPDFELVTSGAFPDLDAVYTGRGGFRKFWDDFYGIWERLATTPQELIDDGDRVIALWVFAGEGRGGVHVGREGAHLVYFRHGLVRRLETHASWEDARAASRSS